MIKESGVYTIYNKITGCFYIGSSVDLRTRLRDHKAALKGNYHRAKYLQYSWNSRKEEDFLFKVIKKCKPEDCLKYEQHYIDALQPEYNTLEIAGRQTGYRHTEEARRKITESSTGRTKSPESRMKISIGHKGKKHSVEHNLNNAKPRWKPVLQICKITGKVLQEFKSISEASRLCNVNMGHIGATANGTHFYKSAGGYIWKFKNQEDAQKQKKRKRAGTVSSEGS